MEGCVTDHVDGYHRSNTDYIGPSQIRHEPCNPAGSHERGMTAQHLDISKQTQGLVYGK